MTGNVGVSGLIPMSGSARGRGMGSLLISLGTHWYWRQPVEEATRNPRHTHFPPPSNPTRYGL